VGQREAYEATRLAPAAEPDPASTDDAQELMDRVIRRAQYLALQAVLAQLDKTHLAILHRNGMGNVVNDAARALGTAEPYRDEAAR
jgi:hypothetical protein